WVRVLNGMSEDERRVRISGYAPVASRDTNGERLPRVAPPPRAYSAPVSSPRSATPAPRPPPGPPPAAPPPAALQRSAPAAAPRPPLPAAAAGSKLDSLLRECGALAGRGLRYSYGAEDPRSGGLDCSGTVQYLLGRQNIQAPRQANHQYLWLQQQGSLKKIGFFTSSRSVLRKLQPGDLLFWKGTYKVKRKPNVTHVMIYLGKDRSGQPLMFGARSSSARGRNGFNVDVFDFDWPESKGKGKFIAYGSIPSLRS
ncbi:MAG: C40 family peptidase, partial [Verrucomicrobiales bacterium]